ncbi:MAG: HEAT repeat domain-containing protein, partial [Fusobacteria bacterium]|nr:HEAT repeat domain-containing protein [Fusobacteriota bacterium]
MIEESKVEKLLNDVYQYEDIKKFNIIFKEASKNEALKKQLLSFIDKNEEKLYYTLVNAPINNELLSEIREMFKLTKRSEMLGNTLKHYDVNVRIYMLRELGKSKTDVFLNWYIEAMQDEHWEVKKELAIIFSNHNSKDTLNLLVSFLDDSDKRVANEA